MAPIKTYFLVGSFGLLAIAGAALFVQYKRLMNYVISFNSIRVKTITQSLVSVDLYLSLINKSDVQFQITSQSYVVYINNKKLTEIGNSKSVQIKKGENIIPLAIAFNPQKTLNDISDTSGLISFLLNPENTKIKIDIKLNVRFYLIDISIPFVYQTTIKDLLTKK